MAISTYADLPSTAEDAKDKSLNKYFTGIQCKRGHISPRYVCNNDCIECAKEKHKAQRDKNGHKWNKKRRQQYEQDESYRKRVRARNDVWRKDNSERLNRQRREKYHSDKDYRESVLAPKRGRDQRDSQLRTHYGITKDDYNEMLSQQGNACAICGEIQENALCVDHCHASGDVRALLCRKCNTGLGCYNDDISLMKKAIEYLEGFICEH